MPRAVANGCRNRHSGLCERSLVLVQGAEKARCGFARPMRDPGETDPIAFGWTGLVLAPKYGELGLDTGKSVSAGFAAVGCLDWQPLRRIWRAHA